MRMEKCIYWAGDRGFRSCTRWHDDETVKILKNKYGWKVLYPFDESIEIDDKECTGFFGIKGSLRKRCLTGIDNCSIIVAYLGSFDTGTAQEIEYGLMKNKPILGWSDSAIVVGEYAGREISVSQENIENLHVNVLPLNGMTAVIDNYIEFSKLGKSTSPSELAEIINEESENILNKQ